MKEWKINIFKIIDTRISFYSRNTHLLPPKPKSSFPHPKRSIHDFHMYYVLVPADKDANYMVECSLSTLVQPRCMSRLLQQCGRVSGFGPGGLDSVPSRGKDD